MKEVADIVTSYATGEWEMEKYTGGRLAPTHDEIAQLTFSLYESRGRQDGHAIEDWLRAPNRNSCGTTRNCEVSDEQTRRIECQSSERLIYDIPKTNFGAGMSHVQHAAGAGG